jgi:hypothetical protein
LSSKTVEQVRFEVDQIDHLLDSYSDLLAQSQVTPPGLVEVTAVASVLHSFYNGLENIWLAIAKGVDADVPSGLQWHRDLLVRMTTPTTTRPAVLTAKSIASLSDYLAFRHFFRHSYSFILEWEEMGELVTRLPQTWADVKLDIRQFLARLIS